MIILELEISGQSAVSEAGDIDWGIVKNTPQVNITNNNHSHTDRYYTQSEVDSRISSLISAIDGLEEKVNNLFN